jgi:hypothetical protein
MNNLVFEKDLVVSDFDLALFDVQVDGVGLGYVTASYERVFFESYKQLSSSLMAEITQFMRQQEVKFFHIE